VTFESRPYELGGYTAVDRPPQRTQAVATQAESRVLLIDGAPAFEADVIVIDFYKEGEFSRQALSEEMSTSDPPTETLEAATNSQIHRLRHVTRGAMLRPLRLRGQSYSVQYLNDDDTELLPEEGKVRIRVGRQFSFQFALCTADIWTDAQSLPQDFEAPVWSELLLDAERALPHVGSAIVLGAVALERFITETLGDLAAAAVKPPELWTWLMSQKDTDKLPSVATMFGELLPLFTGHSLKEDGELWEAMTNLKNARNNFVHRGIPQIGKGTPALTSDQALKLLQQANRIVAKVRGWLPDPAPWPPFTYKHEMELRVMLVGPPPGSEPTKDPGPAA